MYNKIIKENKSFIDNTWQKLENKLSLTSIKSRHKIPYTTVNGVHNDYSDYVFAWTNGFWGGLMWLMYEETKKECYKLTAEESEQKLDKAFEYLEGLHHDVGFMWHITSGANYRLTGNKKSKNRNILAAMSLMSRYNVDGEFIRAWNSPKGGVDKSGWTIIDCMMNINILYWASEVFEDTRFKKVAMKHADTTLRDHIRDNGSVNHIVMHDVDKKGVVNGIGAGQGYSETSCWSRGASWAVYGFILSYIHTKEQRYLDTAIKCANYFIQQTEKTNWLPKLDFDQPENPCYYDSTAGAIASCGLIEIAKITGNTYYLECALKILKTLEEKCCDFTDKEDSILQMCSESYKKEHHKPIIYGDYFFVEAILKLKGSKFLPW